MDGQELSEAADVLPSLPAQTPLPKRDGHRARAASLHASAMQHSLHHRRQSTPTTVAEKALAEGVSSGGAADNSRRHSVHASRLSSWGSLRSLGRSMAATTALFDNLQQLQELQAASRRTLERSTEQKPSRRSELANVSQWEGPLADLFLKLKFVPPARLEPDERSTLAFMLRKHEGFKTLPMSALLNLVRRAQYITFPRRCIILDEACAHTDLCYFVLKGAVQVRSRVAAPKEGEAPPKLHKLETMQLLALRQATGDELDRVLGTVLETYAEGDAIDELALLCEQNIKGSYITALPTEALVFRREVVAEVLHPVTFVPTRCQRVLSKPAAERTPADVEALVFTMINHPVFCHLRPTHMALIVQELQLLRMGGVARRLLWEGDFGQCDFVVLKGMVYLMHEGGKQWRALLSKGEEAPRMASTDTDGTSPPSDQGDPHVSSTGWPATVMRTVERHARRLSLTEEPLEDDADQSTAAPPAAAAAATGGEAGARPASRADSHIDDVADEDETQEEAETSAAKEKEEKAPPPPPGLMGNRFKTFGRGMLNKIKMKEIMSGFGAKVANPEDPAAGAAKTPMQRFLANGEETIMLSKGSWLGAHGVQGEHLPKSVVAVASADAEFLVVPRFNAKVGDEDRNITKLARVLFVRPELRTAADIDLLVALTADNKFLKELPEDSQRELLRYSSFETFSQGSTVFREGTVGDTFFIMLKGQVSIHVKAVPGSVGQYVKQAETNPLLTKFIQDYGGCVMMLSKGASFGELALINSKPRAATIVSMLESYFMTVNKKAYQEVLLKLQMQEYEKTAKYLRYMRPLDGLGTAKLQLICVMLKTASFKHNQSIVCEHDTTSPFYVVKVGELRMVRRVPATVRGAHAKGAAQEQIAQQTRLRPTPPRVKAMIDKAHGVDISPVTKRQVRQQTFAQEGTGAAASGMYMPLTVEIGRMYSGDWFGEETLLGTTASGMPWSVVVDSSEADLLTLHAADFFSTLNEDKFPGLLAYLKEVSYLKQEKAAQRFTDRVAMLEEIAQGQLMGASSTNSRNGPRLAENAAMLTPRKLQPPPQPVLGSPQWAAALAMKLSAPTVEELFGAPMVDPFRHGPLPFQPGGIEPPSSSLSPMPGAAARATPPPREIPPLYISPPCPELEARLAQMSGRTSFKLLSPRTRAGGGGVPHPPLGLLRGSVLQRPPPAQSTYPTYMAPLGHPRTSTGPLADASTPHMVNLHDPAGGRGHIARRLKKKGEKLDLLRADIQRSMSEHT